MRKLIRLSNNKGFTVIELLMAIVILGVVMAAVTTMIVQSFNVFDSSTRRMNADQLAELALSEVGEYLRAVIEVNPESSSEHDDSSNFEESKKYIFQSFYNDEKAKIEIEFNNEQNRLLLTVDYGSDDRTILNNIVGFRIFIDNDNSGDFSIDIEVEDDNGNLARKRLNISSRNL